MQDDNKADFPPPSELAPVPQEAIGVLIARWERKARDEEWNAAIDEAARLCSYFGPDDVTARIRALRRAAP